MTQLQNIFLCSLCRQYHEWVNMSKVFCKFSYGRFFYQMIFHIWIEQLWLIINKWRHYLRIINIIWYKRKLTYLKYPNQGLNIICISLIRLVTLMCDFYIGGGGQTLDHTSMFLFFFLNKLWLAVKSVYFTKIWNVRDCRVNGGNHC